jgi:lipopolysaccharide/colanic/teichoic acid biosynthesis glycosyltransferase
MKRAFDLIVALLALVLLSPVMLVVAILVLAKLGRPVLFVQERPGLHGKPFRIYKFRTMLNGDQEKPGDTADARRMTRLGHFLRSTSLDELPELWNVVKGDMSLVGPRPLLMEYVPLYSPEQARRQDVRPGITGWAQVNGRNTLSWEKKFELDVWYVDNRTFSLDLRILLATIKGVVSRDGIAHPGEVTMTRFRGND